MPFGKEVRIIGGSSDEFRTMEAVEQGRYMQDKRLECIVQRKTCPVTLLQ